MDHPHLWIGTSWKMNKTLSQAMTFANGLAVAPPARGIQRFVIPPFTALREVAKALAGSGVKVGAQNMHWADEGAWTGEISAPMLTDCGADMVEIGHSERRAHFGETDETVGLKAATAVRHGLIPLICIGETLAEREAGHASDVLARQVRAALSAIKDSTTTVLLAYEPVWAIGAGGIPASADYADARQAEIKTVAHKMLGRLVKCLYGGSVNPENCVDLVTRPHIDGLFIGRAAWNVDGYLDILARCAKTLEEST